MGTLGAWLPNLGLWWYVVAAALAPSVTGVVWARAVFLEPETEADKQRKKLTGLAWLKASLNWNDYWVDEAARGAMERLVASVEAGNEMERTLVNVMENVDSMKEEAMMKAGQEALKVYRDKRDILVGSIVEEGK